jgi:recombination protein U
MTAIAANKSNLGKAFESMLERSHEVYAKQKIASMQKNPAEWKYTGPMAYYKMANHPKDLVARTNTGRFLTRVKSTIDFSGVAGGRYVMFDAKQVSRLNFPLSDLPEHQLSTLCFAEQCGAISGLMIHFSTYKRTFFVPARYVEKVRNEITELGGKKSISLTDCEQNGIEVPSSPLVECDWFSVLIG